MSIIIGIDHGYYTIKNNKFGYYSIEKVSN